MKNKYNQKSLKTFQSIVLVGVFLVFTTLNINAQQNVRDCFLVESVSKYISSSDYMICSFVYNEDHQLQSKVVSGVMEENYQVRDVNYLEEFYYENGLVSLIKFYDLTHFLFDQDFHFFYDNNSKLIRKETWKNGFMIDSKNFHYVNGKMVSVYNDNSQPIFFDELFYNSNANIIKREQLLQAFDETGLPIPGQYINRVMNYTYDNHPKPNFGLDYLFAYQPMPWMGTIVDYEILLSNNNLTNALYQEENLVYTYNEYGLPTTIEKIFVPIGPTIGSTFTINYMQIQALETPKINQPTITVYPNPTDQFITVDFDKSFSLILYDMSGREVFKCSENGKSQIDISQLQSGVYNAKIVSDSHILLKTTKIIKR